MDTGFVLEREEHVVVRDGALTPRVDLRVELAARARRAARPGRRGGCPGRGGGRRLSPPACARASRRRAAGASARSATRTGGRVRAPRSSSSFRTVRKSPSQRRFWNAVTIKPRSAAASTSGASLLRVQRERLVDDDRQPRLERGQPEREVALVRRRDHGQVELGRSLPDLIRSPDDLNSGVLPERLVAALFVTGHDHRQPEPRGRGDERRVEDGACEPVAEECHVRGHSWNAAEALGLVVELCAHGPSASRPNGSTLTRPLS